MLRGVSEGTHNIVGMGLLDFDDNYVPPFTPPKPKRYEKQTALSQEIRDSELNNFDREEMDENYKQPEY